MFRGLGLALGLTAASVGAVPADSVEALAKRAAEEALSKGQLQAAASVRLLDSCRRVFQNPETYPRSLLAEVDNDPEIGPKAQALEVCQAYLQARVDANQEVIDRYEGRHP
jgi:hypothetical protein